MIVELVAVDVADRLTAAFVVVVVEVVAVVVVGFENVEKRMKDVVVVVVVGETRKAVESRSRSVAAVVAGC